MDWFQVREERQRRQEVEWIRNYIRNRIQPFDPGLVTVVLDESFNRVIITSSTFVDDVFKMDRDDLAYEVGIWPYLETRLWMAAVLGTEAGQFFLRRMDVKPEANIILGEN